MNALLVGPVVIGLATATLALVAWGRPHLQRAIATAGLAAQLAVAVALFSAVYHGGTRAVALGGWPAPYGIVLVADTLSALMVLTSSALGLLICLYAYRDIDADRARRGFYPLLCALLAGVCGAFLTGDLFNLYVCFEIMLISSFVLLSLGGERRQLSASMHYMALNLFSTAVLLAGTGLVYGAVGTLNFADLSVKLSDGRHGLLPAISMLFFVAFSIKAAVFPFYGWLPASYPTPPPVISALFAALLTKVGVYAQIRFFTLVFAGQPFLQTLLLWVAGLTMVFGVLGAVAQNDFRRILSVHIVSQIGYMLMGLGLGTPLALAGAVFCVVHNMIVKTNLFLIAGVVRAERGTEALARLGGYYRGRPWLAIAFLLTALSLAGLPPSTGFLAKLTLVQAGLATQHYTIVGVSLAVSLFTLLSMTKIWAAAFWAAKPAEAPAPAEALENTTGAMPADWARLVPIAVLTVVAVTLGVVGTLLMDVCLRVGSELHDPSAYLAAVLGGE